MNERRKCDGCGKEYWATQEWLHKGCERSSGSNPAGGVDITGARDRIDLVSGGDDTAKSVATKQRWSRQAYNAYQRDYMRSYRLKKRAGG